jgi:intracellular sulfur oxidation DsrE/DsrF family protein
VARAVNLFASAGVPQSHLNLVVVIHGTATPIVLDNAHYQEKFKLENPNIALIDALEKAGVKVAVCGQALAGNKFPQEWVYPKIENTLSAITDIVILEKNGYVLIPL